MKKWVIYQTNVQMNRIFILVIFSLVGSHINRSSPNHSQSPLKFRELSIRGSRKVELHSFSIFYSSFVGPDETDFNKQNKTSILKYLQNSISWKVTRPVPQDKTHVTFTERK